MKVLWNEFIFRKYNNLVKIDRNLLKEELIKNISNKKNMNTSYQKYYLKLTIMNNLKANIKIF